MLRHVLFPLVVSLLWLLAGGASVVPAMMSVMMFDAPGSTENGALWWLVYSVWAFPVLSVISAISVWIGWALARRREPTAATRALVLVPTLLPLAAVASGAAALLVSGV